MDILWDKENVFNFFFINDLRLWFNNDFCFFFSKICNLLVLILIVIGIL